MQFVLVIIMHFTAFTVCLCVWHFFRTASCIPVRRLRSLEAIFSFNRELLHASKSPLYYLSRQTRLIFLTVQTFCWYPMANMAIAEFKYTFYPHVISRSNILLQIKMQITVILDSQTYQPNNVIGMRYTKALDRKLITFLLIFVSSCFAG